MSYVLSQQYSDGAHYQLEHVGSLLTLAGVEYADLAAYSKPLQLIIGYLNHDLVYFRPKTTEDEDLEKKRQALAQQYVDTFRSWLEDQAELETMIVEAFNRLLVAGCSPPTTLVTSPSRAGIRKRCTFRWPQRLRMDSR